MVCVHQIKSGMMSYVIIISHIFQRKIYLNDFTVVCLFIYDYKL